MTAQQQVSSELALIKTVGTKVLDVASTMIRLPALTLEQQVFIVQASNDLTKGITWLQANLQSQTEALGALRASKDEVVASKEEHLQSLDQEIVGLKAHLNAKDEQINSLLALLAAHSIQPVAQAPNLHAAWPTSTCTVCKEKCTHPPRIRAPMCRSCLAKRNAAPSSQ